MDVLLLHVKNEKPTQEWRPGDICYYWYLGKIHKAIFCKWTVGDKLWAAVFDTVPTMQPVDNDGYDYMTVRVTYDDLFATKEELVEAVVVSFRNAIIAEEH